MTYSRRQLYALGETFGSCATHRGVGGKIIYGGGSDAPPPPATVEPTTRVTEHGPDMTSFNRSSTNEIPRYLTDASQDLVARGKALTNRPYEAYTGARVAEFTPDMEAAFKRMRNQQIAPQIGEATGLAGLAGRRASDYGMFQEGVQQYMNPYMQNVVDVERRKAQENADRQSAMLSGQAVRQGAFGGSGAALQQRALTRDTAQQLADIQALGLGRAYEQAAGQYNTGISNMLGASGQLGSLGQQQFGQEMDITKGLGTAGDVQRQREQALLDVGYGDYLTEQKYPYEQLAFQQGLVAGVPYSTTQRSAGQEISQRGKTVEQTMKTTEKAPNNQVDAITPMPTLMNRSDMAAGGVVGHYDEGGITSLLSDQQIDQRQQMPNISDLARMALQAEELERAQLRAAQQGIMAQRPQGTVADEERARIAAIEGGIGGLDVRDDLVGNEYTAAGGGIVAFQPGGQVGSPNIYGLPAISNSLIPKPAQDLMAQQRRLAQDVSEQERLAAEENLAAVRRDQAALGDYTKNQEDRLQKREQGLEGADAGALQSSVLDFGLRLLSAKGKANQAAALAEAGLGTLKSHRDALDRIEKEKKDIDDARNRLDELRYSNKKTDLGAIRDAEKDLKSAKINGTKALSTLIGADAKTVIDAYDKQQSRSAQYAAANKPTDMRNYVRDVELAAKGDPQAQIRVDAAKAYIGTQREAQLTNAQTAAGKSEYQIRKEAMEITDQTLSFAGDRNKRKEYNDLAKLDKKDGGNRAEEYKANLFDKILGGLTPASAAPAATPAPAPAPAASGTRPDISSIRNAPQGSTIGAQTSRGWEVKDRSGKVIGYAQ